MPLKRPWFPLVLTLQACAHTPEPAAPAAAPPPPAPAPAPKVAAQDPCQSAAGREAEARALLAEGRLELAARRLARVPSGCETSSGRELGQELERARSEAQGETAPLLESALAAAGSDLPRARRLRDQALFRLDRARTRVTVLRHLPFDGDARTSALSPSGRLLALADELDIVVTNLEKHEMVARLSGHAGDINSLAFSPDETVLASASDEGRIRLWKLSTGQELPGGPQSKEQLSAVDFSPDGTKLTGIEGKDSERSWPSKLSPQRALAPESPSQEPIEPPEPKHPPKQEDACHALRWDGKYAVRMTLPDHELTVSAGKRKIVVRREDPNYCWEVRFSPDRPWATITLGNDDKGETLLVDLDKGKVLKSLASTKALSFMGGSDYLLQEDSDGRSLWSIASGARIDLSERELVQSSDGRVLVALSSEAVSVFHLGKTLSRRDYSRPRFTSLAGDPGARALLVQSAGGGLYTWRAGSVRPELLARGQTLAAVSDDGKRALSSATTWHTLWDLERGQALGTYALGPAESFGAETLALSPDGRELVHVEESRIVVFDATSGKELRQVALTGEQATGMQRYHDLLYPSSGGRYLMGSTRENQRESPIFDLAQQRWLAGPIEHGGASQFLLRSDGTLIYSGHERSRGTGANPIVALPALLRQEPATHRRDCQTAQWDIQKRVVVRNFDGCGDVALSPDGKTLAIGGNNGADLWNVDTGFEAGRLLHAGDLRGLSFAHDGKLVTAVNETGFLRAWSPGRAEALVSFFPLAGGLLVEDEQGRVALYPDDATSSTEWTRSAEGELRCLVGNKTYPFFVCEDRFLTDDLAGKRLHGEELDPFITVPASP